MNNNEIFSVKEKNPLYGISKEDISTNLIEMDFEVILWEYFSWKMDISPSEEIDLTKKHIDSIMFIINKFGVLNKTISNIKIYKTWKLYIEYKKNWKKDKLVFDLENRADIFIWNIYKIKQLKESQNKKAVKLLERSNNILLAMDEVFSSNEKEWFWELNEKDILKNYDYWKDLPWLNLKELQEKFKENFDIVRNLPKQNLNPSIKKDLVRQEKIYLEMIMWVWDKYEGWAKFLVEKTENFKNILADIVNLSDTKDILKYLKQINEIIDNNNYQSTTVEGAYKLLWENINKKILKKLISSNAENKDFVFFAEIITWRWRNWENSDIDDNLRDQDTANEALLYMMNRKKWIIDKLNRNNTIKLEDKEIKNKTPIKVINQVKNDFYEKFWEKYKSKNLFYNQLKTAWYEDILNIDKDLSYNDLTFEQKTKLSVLYRVWEKLKDGKNLWTKTKEFDFIDNEEYVLKEFSWLFNEVALDYRGELIDILEDNFWSNNPFSGEWFWFWKSAKELWLKWVEAEAFNLFQDINWNWLFDLSDTSVEYLKTWWKFVWVIVVAIAVPLIILPTMWIVAQEAAAWAAASIASMVINPHWYDTKTEAVVDIVSDVTVWTVTWMAGGSLAKSWWYEWAKLFSKQWRRNAYIFAGNLTFLWLGPEVIRQKYLMDNNFHDKAFLEN